MRYRFEPVDLAVVSGAPLTIFAAALLWISTQGSFHVTTAMQSSPDMAVTTLEEEMGKNLVAASLLENRHSKDIARVAKKLNTETLVAGQVSTSGHEAVQHVINERQEQERSNAARIEFVKGRSIVNATLRAKRSERVSDERWAQWNQRAIAMAAKEGNRIQRAFRSNAPETLQTAFVNETQAHRTLWQHSQEEAGTAIVRTSLVQKAYERESANLQEQIGSLVSRAAAANLL